MPNEIATITSAIRTIRGQKVLLDEDVSTHDTGSGFFKVAICDLKEWARPTSEISSLLIQNTAAVAFWRAMGYQDYSLTLQDLPVAGVS